MNPREVIITVLRDYIRAVLPIGCSADLFNNRLIDAENKLINADRAVFAADGKPLRYNFPIKADCIARLCVANDGIEHLMTL